MEVCSLISYQLIISIGGLTTFKRLMKGHIPTQILVNRESITDCFRIFQNDFSKIIHLTFIPRVFLKISRFEESLQPRRQIMMQRHTSTYCTVQLDTTADG